MGHDDVYEPELGQAVFGQPYFSHPLPEIWEAALGAIDHELCRIMWNIHQREYGSPFSNTGARFEELSEFQARAYSWDDEASEGETWNFRWRDIEIRWYKYMGRGSTISRRATPDEAAQMLSECIAALRRFEETNDPQRVTSSKP